LFWTLIDFFVKGAPHERQTKNRHCAFEFGTGAPAPPHGCWPACDGPDAARCASNAKDALLMAIESQLLNRLKAEQQEFSLEALKRPVSRDAFEYGYRVGMVAGLEAAMKTLLDMLDEERNGDRDL
jgi:hypothetical protein